MTRASSSKIKAEPLKIRDILKGKFLVEDVSFSNWKFLFFLIFLALLMITSSHLADRKVLEISKLKEQVSELNSTYTFVHQSLMYQKRESAVAKRIAPLGLITDAARPFKISKLVSHAK
ncbi:MAG: S-adenosyl-methyltransferase [Flavobacteriaceae bacterium]|nr:MAG: S-adenosyl-methyltransferase [Flavobacteriaceae bacterium]